MHMPNNEAGSSNKLWYIVGGIAVLIILGWIFTRSAGFMAMRAAGVSATPGANGAVTYSGAEGSVTVGGGSMPSNWPSDAPGNYAGATIQYSGTSNPQTGKAGSAVVYTVQASAQSVADYYKAQLASKGWTVSATANTGAATVLSATKDSRTLGVYIVDAGNGQVSVTTGIEM